MTKTSIRYAREKDSEKRERERERVKGIERESERHRERYLKGEDRERERKSLYFNSYIEIRDTAYLKTILTLKDALTQMYNINNVKRHNCYI